MPDIGELVVGLTLAAGSYQAGLAQAGAATDKTTSGMKEGLGKATKSGEGFNAVLKEMGLGSLTTIASVAGVTGAVIGAGKAAYDAMQGWSKLATQVESYSRLTNTSAEDSSKLIESTGDLGISFEALEKAMETASRNGLDTSIQGIKNLSEQYLKLNPGQERAKFLMDNLGKSGEDLAKYMELGAAGIDKVTKAVTGAKVITEQQIELNKRLKESQNNFNDVFEDTKLQVGGALAGPFTNLLTWYNKMQTANSETGTSWLTWIPIVGAVTQAIRIKQQAEKDDAEAAKEAADASIAQGIDNQARAFTEQARAVQESVDATTRLNLAAYDAAHGLNGMGYEYQFVYDASTAANIAMGETTTTIAPLNQAITDVTGLFQAWTAEILFNKIAQVLDADAAWELAARMGLINSEAMITASNLDLLLPKYDLDRDGKISNTEATEEFYQAMVTLNAQRAAYTDKTVTITTVFQTLGASAPGLPAQPTTSGGGIPAGGSQWWTFPATKDKPEHKEYAGNDYYYDENGNLHRIPGRALGGSVRAGLPYMVGENGPEPFVPTVNGTIIPNNQMGKLGLGGGPIDWTGFPLDALARVMRDAVLLSKD